MANFASVYFEGAKARSRYCKMLTSGMVGATVYFRFDGPWTAVEKTIIFKAGEVSRGLKIDTIDNPMYSGPFEIPPEVLAEPNHDLFIGVYGTNADGTVVIPSTWAFIGKIYPGTSVDGVEVEVFEREEEST